jgi:hypothetical protein
METVLRVYNNTGSTITNGQVVYVNGAFTNRPTVTLGNNQSIVTSEDVIAMATHNIPHGEEGFVTGYGYVRGLDTSLCSAGDQIYLDSVDGGWTKTKPVFGNWIVELGRVLTVSATEGEILFTPPRLKDNDQFFNGTIAENFDFLVTSDGVNVTGSLERAGGGDLSLRLSNGYHILDCTLGGSGTDPQTIDLTPDVGTDSIPKTVYIYIDKSTPTIISSSTTGYPTTEHIPIAYTYLPSVTKIQSDGGPYINQNINNYMASVSTQIGRLQLMSKKIRRLGLTYESGVEPDGDSGTYFVHAASSVKWKSTSGVIFQMHEQNISAYDMTVSDDAHVVNDPITPYLEISDLFSITTDSGGNTITNNRYFNLVFWMVGNKTGQNSPLMVNLSNGFYQNVSLALIDAEQLNVYDIPRQFNIESSTGFLIGWATFQMGTNWDSWWR